MEMRRTRGGFTLIELMVVIGIILVLVSIVVIGLRHVNYTAARHETVAELKICADMLKEYESVNNLAGIEEVAAGRQVPKSGIPASAPLQFQLPVYLDQPPTNLNYSGEIKNGNNGESAIQAVDVATGAGSDMGDKSDQLTPRYGLPNGSSAVSNTQMVMYLLLRDPKNRATLATVPAKRILEGQVITPGTPAKPFPMDYAVVLDGWGNPIIYVPRGGLHVFMPPNDIHGKLQEFVVRTSGTTWVGATPPLNLNDHPFFASAGQDGSFTDSLINQNPTDYGSDNIYSFQD
jgi:prepilin-type N-terminal cleavage/methylation domain-containing protein